ncbi:DUF1538 domain-containing protein [Ramlibacter alkalitolerans]|uniref:DUF1538 domain-containing protein n=1 Tax=Ramlibacter alkalitolerans TaxID=2039631 RepID=A0ABS1JNF3_9BURK|nr:DUF1538 domain-containing protein [Ramlibacter alkalitolerans]MBL0425401.1 DUF1538 domain-containing protein [Ramlibacter alkalitolerans]
MNAAPWLEQVLETGWSVLLAILPLALVFLVFQALFLRMPAREVRRILLGTVLAALGLFLFLLGVGLAFLPFGRITGEALGALPQQWLVVPLGVLLGFVTTWGEPAVRILADQVEEASGGSIRRSLVLVTVCVGVALAVGLGLFRIDHEIPLLVLLVPGYGIMLGAMWLCRTDFVAIGADAGGVATGPLANSFLLALAFGASSTMGGQDPLVHGLGLVALIALAPALSVMVLGIVVGRKGQRKESPS